MSYNNYRPQNQSNGYSRSGGNFRNGYNNSQGGSNGPAKKRSGCSMKDSYIHKSGPNKGRESGCPVIWGWKVAQGGGLIKFVAVPNKKTDTKNPRWKKFCVTVTPPNGANFLTTGFWDIDKMRLHIPDMSLIANPAKNYFGRNYKPKTSR